MEEPGSPSLYAPVLVSLSDVPRQEVAWLREPYLPQGRLVLFDGDPGVGKSKLTQAIASAVTVGAPLPGQAARSEPANVLLLTAEDGLGDTVRPWMEDMGADLNRVTVLKAVRDDKGKEQHPSLVDDLPALEMALITGGYRLVIIDPINAYLGMSLDTHRDAALRAVLTPLALLAERWAVTILCIRHLTKGGRDRAIYRGQGTIAYAAAARAVYLVGINPDDERERVMACIKHNLAPLPPSLAFEIVDGRFLWRGQTTVTAAALLAPDRSDDAEGDALSEAMEFLRSLLADGRVAAEDGWRQARKLGIADRTLKRAKAALKVKTPREGYGPDGRWFWELPKEAHRGPDPLYRDGWPPMRDSDTKSGQGAGELAPYDGTTSACPHRPAKEVEKHWAGAGRTTDPFACVCCGGPVRPETSDSATGICPVCRDGRPVKAGSGHLVRQALDLGATLVEDAVAE